MKSSYIAIGTDALFAVLVIGGCIIDALYCLKAGDERDLVLDLAIAILLGLIVRSDVRQTLRNGTYHRGWCVYELRREKEGDEP